MDESRMIITASEANQDFSKVTGIADEYGDALVFENNLPIYKHINSELEPDLELTDDEKIDIVETHSGAV